jgi:hypothetical protein
MYRSIRQAAYASRLPVEELADGWSDYERKVGLHRRGAFPVLVFERRLQFRGTDQASWGVDC